MTAAAERLRRTLADMIAQVSEGDIGPEDALAADHTLSALGLTSLARIRLIDAIEDTFGVEVDLSGDLAVFERVDTLADHLAGLLGEPTQ
jgi:acyl carrier protein